MPRTPRLPALVALLACSASAWAGEPPPSAPPGGDLDSACEAPVVAWAEAASTRAGVAIQAASCPGGLVRFTVAGAGCDFEVRNGAGFQRTADGAFGVSPIANLDWSTAPEPMKKGLASIVAALAQDPSLRIPSEPRRRSSGAMLPGSRRDRIALGAGVAALVAAVSAIFWKRRRARLAAPPPP